MRIRTTALGATISIAVFAGVTSRPIEAGQAPPPCDGVVHDKLAGAQMRSPSECEVQFDLAVRRAEHQAFAAVLAQFGQGSWTKPVESSLAAVTGVARGNDKESYRPGLATSGDYHFTLQMSPASADYRALAKRRDDLMAKMQLTALIR